MEYCVVLSFLFIPIDYLKQEEAARRLRETQPA